MGELSHFVGQVARALAMIDWPECTPEDILQQRALDAESASEE